MTVRAEGQDPRTGAIIGAAIEVHRQLGHGFLEPVYQEALSLELAARGVPHRQEVLLPVQYKGRTLACVYRADFLCYDDIIVEVKALAAIGNIEQAQVINYLKATGLRLGLLLNFGAPRLQIKRIVFDAHLCRSVPSVDECASSSEE